MRHVDELRHALADETANLHINVSTGLIRRRARRVRVRRVALAAGLVLALAIPAGVLAAGPDRRDHDVARPGPTCVTPPGADDGIPWIGEPIELEIGDQYNRTGRHKVLVGLIGGSDTPILTVVFRYEATGVEEFVHETRLRRTPDGGFALRDSTDTGRRLMSVRMNFGALEIIDLGLYAGWADRITIGADGATAVAVSVHNEQTGWTLFWARHEPWSPQAADGAQVELTAYATNGELLATAPGTPGAGFRPESTNIPRAAPGPLCTGSD